MVMMSGQVRAESPAAAAASANACMPMHASPCLCLSPPLHCPPSRCTWTLSAAQTCSSECTEAEWCRGKCTASAVRQCPASQDGCCCCQRHCCCSLASHLPAADDATAVSAAVPAWSCCCAQLLLPRSVGLHGTLALPAWHLLVVVWD